MFVLFTRQLGNLERRQEEGWNLCAFTREYPPRLQLKVITAQEAAVLRPEGANACHTLT